jgi:beclin 1
MTDVDLYRIYKDRISGHSIRLPGISAMQIPTLSSMSIMGLGSSSTDRDKDKAKEDSTGEETWTRACRAVLMILKRILMVESEVDRTVVETAWKESTAGTLS